MNGATEKIKVDLLLTGGTVIVMDEGRNLLENGALAITDDKIVAVGTTPELTSRYEAATTLDCTGKAVLPGFINAHTHVPMVLLRGLADDLRLDVWLMGYMLPVEREFVSPEFVRLGTQLACAEMIKTGTTCFNDMYYFEDDIAQATADAGMRAVCSSSVMKFPTPDAASYEDAIVYARKYIARWKDHPLIVPGIAPHAPYTCPPEILKAATEVALEFDAPLHIHIAETALEVENSRKEHNMPVVPWIKKQGVLEAKVIAAHCVHIDEGEMHSFKHAGTGVAHNPSSNLKLASGFAPVQQMLNIGVNVGIGTDGAASNNDLDMLEETRLAAFVAKGFSGDPTALPAREALALATIGSAKALHISHLTGSLEPGKRADLQIIDLQPLHNAPRFRRDPDAVYSQIVYAAKSSDILDVMCNGRWLMQDRQLLTLNETDLRTQAQEMAQKIDQFLISREENILRKLVALGGWQEEESFEVQVKAHLDSLEGVQRVLTDKNVITITKTSRYRQYDTYFKFHSPDQGQLRIREDIYLDEKGNPTPHSRFRLTLIGAASEEVFPHSIMLSRARYTANADQSIRFYREYLNPTEELEVTKLRRRNRFQYKNTDFAINVDQTLKPSQNGFVVEIKSRTWSKRDAERKAELIAELLNLMSIGDDEIIKQNFGSLATV
jgi:5-methylthioadenosine/S-adenosylhomocysteine deaminase